VKLPSFSLSQAVVKLEDSIITLSGPALAISGILAGVDVVTNNAIASMFGEVGIIWAICLLLSLDFQVLALGCKAHRLYHASGKHGFQKWAELALIFMIALALAYVSLQMHSIFARVTGAGVSIEVAQQQLGINPIALIYERSALVMVLIFMSGWLRGSHQTSQPETRVPAPVSDQKQDNSLSDETVQLILSKLAKLDALEQAIATHQVTVTSVEEPLTQLPAPAETPMETSETREQASETNVAERETEQPVQPLRALLPSVSGIAADDVAKVIGAHLQGITRRDICAHLKWGSSKYSSIVKPVLDVWEQTRNVETAETEREASHGNTELAAW
jgi:hypothetical protein